MPQIGLSLWRMRLHTQQQSKIQAGARTFTCRSGIEEYIENSASRKTSLESPFIRP